jgi:hypothetical protein
MAVEQRRMRNGQLVWYSTILNDYSERHGELLNEENKEIHRRKNNTANAIEAEFAKLPMEEIRRLDKEQNQQEAAEQINYEQNRLISVFCRDNPWLADSLYNRDVIISRIKALIQQTDRPYASWTNHDFQIALDSLADDGALQTNGPYVRQSRISEAETMPIEDLRQLAVEQLAGPRPEPRNRRPVAFSSVLSTPKQ